jgi:hypothetical protein
VTSALLPEPLAPGARDVVLFEADRETFSLAVAPQGARATVRRRVWLDRDALHAVRVRRYDARGDLESEVQLGAWQGDAPRRIQIDRPAEGYEAILDLDKAERNVPVPEQAFVPRTPEGYKLVEVSQGDLGGPEGTLSLGSERGIYSPVSE